ncbi:MAG: hypothetical protein IJ083_02865 [Clostridia bacterium]|nr:hypothetical protein [Clostridia bacterium]
MKKRSALAILMALCLMLCLSMPGMAEDSFRLSLNLQDGETLVAEPVLQSVMISVGFWAGRDVAYTCVIDNLTTGEMAYSTEGTLGSTFDALVLFIPAGKLNSRDEFGITVTAEDQTVRGTFRVEMDDELSQTQMRITSPADGSVLEAGAELYEFDLTGMAPGEEAEMRVVDASSGEEVISSTIDGEMLSNTIGGARFVMQLPGRMFRGGGEYIVTLSQGENLVSSTFSVAPSGDGDASYDEEESTAISFSFPREMRNEDSGEKEIELPSLGISIFLPMEYQELEEQETGDVLFAAKCDGEEHYLRILRPDAASLQESIQTFPAELSFERAEINGMDGAFAIDVTDGDISQVSIWMLMDVPDAGIVKALETYEVVGEVTSISLDFMSGFYPANS